LRKQKIRGFNRRLRHIEIWRQAELDLRLDLVEAYKGWHSTMLIHPWCDISLINSIIPEPKGKVKRQMLEALLDIYESWKSALDKRGEPYYLKIWLYEPRFSKSQVVCGISESINHYEHHFFEPDVKQSLQLGQYGQLKERLQKFNWSYKWDEDWFDSNFVGEPEHYGSYEEFEESKVMFEKLLKKPHRKDQGIDFEGNETALYAFHRGDLWVGGYE
jgi:hypothetical protein